MRWGRWAAAPPEVGIHGLHPELIRLLMQLEIGTSFTDRECVEAFHQEMWPSCRASCRRESGWISPWLNVPVYYMTLGKPLSWMEGTTHIQLRERNSVSIKPAVVLNTVESHHWHWTTESLSPCISYGRRCILPLKTGCQENTGKHTKQLKQLEDITNSWGVVNTSWHGRGREVRIMVVPRWN